LDRFESETLPQYFRHNRFQSFVRQLNFYHFRKINRERSFWVYQHHLFHRDKPENLHLLRRRTRPQSPGESPSASEKNAMVGTRRSSRTSSANATDSSSGDDASQKSDAGLVRVAKRKTIQEHVADLKRSRVSGKAWYEEEEKKSDDPSDGQTSLPRHELAEQSLIVSEVARRLDEYAREAKKPGGLARLRASETGVVVTPPGGGGPCYHYVASGEAGAGQLLTYDDEYEIVLGPIPRKLFRRVSSSSSVASEAEGDLASATDEVTVVSETSTPDLCHAKIDLALSPPVKNLMIADSIAKKIASIGGNETEGGAATASIAKFCMSTATHEGRDLSSKIYQLLNSSNRLTIEFQRYRAALQPLEQSAESLTYHMFAGSAREENAVSLKQIWAGVSSRNDAVRDFKTFAVNIMQDALEMHPDVFTEEDQDALRLTAEVWLKSACIS
jgi:hypothetical protein